MVHIAQLLRWQKTRLSIKIRRIKRRRGRNRFINKNNNKDTDKDKNKIDI